MITSVTICQTDDKWMNGVVFDEALSVNAKIATHGG